MPRPGRERRRKNCKGVFKMKVGEFITQKFLSAKMDKDIDGKTFVIDSVHPEIINEQRKLVIRFKGLDKPLVLNQTNLNALTLNYGDDTDQWINQKVTLMIITVMFNGAPTDGIQVKIK
jgi:hypothetical protein